MAVKFTFGDSVALLISVELAVGREYVPSAPLIKAEAVLLMITKGCEVVIRWKV